MGEPSNQKLFNYLHSELGVIALQGQMHDIERIVIEENAPDWITIKTKEDLPKDKKAVFVYWEKQEEILLVEVLSDPSELMLKEWKKKGFTKYCKVETPALPKK